MPNNNDLFLTLKQAFPEHIQPSEIDNCVAQIIAPNQDNNELQGIGGLMVICHQEDSQENNDSEKHRSEKLWLRNFLPQSHYPIEDIDELLAIIDGVIHNELFWVMEYKLDESGDIDTNSIDSWQGVSLIDKDDLIENQHIAEEGIAYQVLSWLGDFDRIM